MSINPNNMRVVDVARLLNSTAQGFVLAQARLYRDFNRVGFRIAATDNTRNINLLKYIAWMCDQKHTPEEPSAVRTYDERRDAERNRQAEQSLAGRDIAPLPEVVNPPRKADCARNFRLFCESYFPETYSLEWSPDHLKAIEKIETAVLSGGLFALAMPRGSGKSTMTETAALWAMLYGHREFGGLLPRRTTGGHFEPVRRSAISRRTDENHLDQQRNRSADNRGKQGIGNHRPGSRDNRAGARNEVQALRRSQCASKPRNYRRSPDLGKRRFFGADPQARPCAGWRHSGLGRTRTQNFRNHAMHNHPTGRHGGHYPEPEHTSGLERGENQDGLQVPDEHETLGRVCGTSGGVVADRRQLSEGD